MQPIQILAAAVLATIPVRAADMVTIDHTAPGAAFDGIIDGFPGLAARDGTADFGGNPLSIVRKGDVVELRSVLELPLAALDGVLPEAIATATLHFNIDDVLSTLGPDTDLNGEAAGRLFVHFYDGDGSATLADYQRTDEPPVEVLTGATITDASLRQSGARFFTVDATARLRAARQAGTAILGILWRTNDSPTGSSLDDGRGGSASGEPAETSTGSRMPYLTITLADPPDPGCGNGVVEAGESCDDGNLEPDDCCDATCAPSNPTRACDDGNACTTGDACTDGRCVGRSGCGDATVAASCGEECDDGNDARADGCAQDCRHDALTGGSGAQECLVTIALAEPSRTATGALDPAQRCRDGDPCDSDPADGVCGIEAAVCIARRDLRLPDCVPPPALRAAVAGRAGAPQQSLMAAVRELPPGGCTTPNILRVPLRRSGARRREGKLKLVVTGRADRRRRDRDVLVLRCMPRS